jgi:tetratricopeptide (TPR) repeat protein
MASLLRSKRHGIDPEQKARDYRLMQRRALLAARTRIPVKEYEQFLDWFSTYTAAESQWVRNLPVGIDFLLGVLRAPKVPLRQEIAWLTARLRAIAPDLNRFLNASRTLEDLVWRSAPDEALRAISDFEEQFGQSMWLLSLRIATEQAFNGLEAQKAYVGGLKDMLKRGLVPYVAHYTSVRNEPGVSWSWFVDDVSSRISRSRYDDAIKVYLRFQLLGSWPADESSISDILRIEQSHSDIDVYETYVSLVQQLISRDPDGSATAAIRSSLQKLSAITDPRLDKARAFVGAKATLDARLSESAAELLKGNVKEALRLSARELRERPRHPEEALVQAFAAATSKRHFLDHSSTYSSKLWPGAIKALSSIYQNGTSYRAALDRLQKLAANFRSTAVGQFLFATAAAETSGDLLDMAPALRQAALNNDAFTFCDARANLHHTSLASGPVAAFFYASHNDGPMPTTIDTSIQSFGEAVAAARRRDWPACVAASEIPAKTGSEALRTRAVLVRMNALLRLDALDPVIEAIEEEVTNDGIASELLPHVALVEGRPWGELRPSGGRLGLALALDMALKATGNDRTATMRRFAFDEFLKSQGVAKASELDPSKFARRALVYFLKNVAVPPVLDMSDALHSTREIQVERRRVLAILADIDPENAAEYQDDILAITHELEIAEGLRLVDSSRIHVDTDAIEAWGVRELNDGFTRYTNLVASGIGIAEDFNAVLQTVTAIRKKGESGKHLFAIPTNEADELLVSLIRQFLERFIHDPAHGLDSYLSRRIRHGSIVGYLRGPVEEQQLVTLRDEASDDYLPNMHWLGRMPELDADEQALVQKAFDEFSRKYDDALINLRDNIIQIRSPEHPHGLFDVKLYAEQYHLIRSAAQDEGTFPIFASVCFASFWGILDRHLSDVRIFIKDTLRGTLAECFSVLREQINGLQEDVSASRWGCPPARVGVAELSAALTAAQNALQAALEDVAAWFTRSEIQSARRPYALHDAVNIAIESALATLRRFDPVLNVSAAPDVGILATDLPSIAEIIQITISNASERSGIETNVPIDIHVKLSDDEKLLIFHIRNEVAPHKRLEEHRATVDAIREEIASGSTNELVRKERRSGLRKLGALKARLPASLLEFGFTETGFEVTVGLPFTSLKLAELAMEEDADANPAG